ncbi:MAG: DUF1800 domain-containing protein [Fimbriimonadaceae bacterium]|nr:DUF1800 domain-containing protein [Fimbriimonadaceae bacterium]QYK56256.1 MAG: DUF1800 domain-containing protein [Fimbriimonadaceae bacterium]
MLRRFGLGASEAELDSYVQGGYEAAVDRLLGYEALSEPAVPLDRFANSKGQLPVKLAQVWWYARVLSSQRPLEYALTLFWHDHFATSAQKVDSGPAMVNHVETLRKHCAGPFLDLLTAVSKDPAMLYWLDNRENKKGSPNENFAREVMELFTLGIGHYSEADVQEAARAFTGWTYGIRRGARFREVEKPGPNVSFSFERGQHDAGSKTILGQSGDFDGDAVLGLLARHPQTALRLTAKFWSWFAYPDPDPKLIERLAANWVRDGLVVSSLVRAIALSPEFLSEKALRAEIKNPVQFCVSTLRQLGLGQAVTDRLASDQKVQGTRAAGPALLLIQSTTSMGMELMYPPDVSGWKTGDAWITSATMVERMKWADRLFGVAQIKGQASVRYPAWPLFRGDPTPEGVAKRLVSLFDASLPQAKMDQLVAACREKSGGAVTAGNAGDVAQVVARLIFGSPEFQFG